MIKVADRVKMGTVSKTLNSSLEQYKRKVAMVNPISREDNLDKFSQALRRKRQVELEHTATLVELATQEFRQPIKKTKVAQTST